MATGAGIDPKQGPVCRMTPGYTFTAVLSRALLKILLGIPIPKNGKRIGLYGNTFDMMNH